MLTLRAFGALDLRDADGAPLGTVLAQSKRAALLAYLAIARPGQLHRRDSLLALFWPDLDQPRGRSALSQALSFLRREVGEGALVTQGPEEVGVDVAHLRCDVLAFHEALKNGDWAGALELYQGDLLEGLHVKGAPEFLDWVDRERTRLRETAAEAAWKHAHGLVAAGRPVEAERVAQRALELVATDESPVRGFIEALARAGDRGAALRFYEKFKGVLAAELEVEPAPETMAVAEAVRRGEMGVEGAPPIMDASPRPFGEAQGGALPPASVPGARATRRPRERVILGGVALAVLVAGGVALGRWLRPDTPEQGGSSPPHRTAIAVLPFQNLSGQGAHAYFAGGLHDELLTQLSKVAALTVMGRTSVMAYEGTAKPLRDIAGELGVGSVLEGSVQVVGERLRVNVQLLDAASGEHLWAERYDGTLEDAFAIQSEIAREVVASVGATLTESEAAAIAAAPTANPGAYLLYLQGTEYWRRPDYLRRNTEIAQGLFERAIALDSTFALAYAALSQVHGLMSWYRFDPSPERLALQQETAETALRLAPNLPQAHLAMGLVRYWGRRDFRGAMAEFEVALQGMPNDAELRANIGYIHRRLGNWGEVLDAFETVTVLDPRNVNHMTDLGAIAFTSLRRYPEAVEWLSHSIVLAPDVAEYDVRRGWTWVLWQGRLDSLGAALNRHPPDADLGAWGSAREWNAQRLLLERELDSLLALLRDTPQRIFESQESYLPTSLFSAWAHELRGDGPAALEAFDSARIHLDSAPAMLSDDWRIHAARGLALAGLGLREEARREARWIQQSPIYREDAHGRVNLGVHRALILAQNGDAEVALEEIERLLASPGVHLSVPLLRLDPRWDPLRDDLRFQALLAKYADPGPVG